MLPNCIRLAHHFVLKHTTSYNICMYVWMVRMPFKRPRGELFSLQKTRLFILKLQH